MKIFESFNETLAEDKSQIPLLPLPLPAALAPATVVTREQESAETPAKPPVEIEVKAPAETSPPNETPVPETPAAETTVPTDTAPEKE